MKTRNTVLEDICAEIGYTATSALAGWYGGENIRIPLEASPENKIGKLIGVNLLERLVKAFPGEIIFIPKDGQLAIIRREREIYNLVVKGESERKIAELMSMTPFGVRGARRRLEEAGLLPLILGAQEAEAEC